MFYQRKDCGKHAALIRKAGLSTSPDGVWTLGGCLSGSMLVSQVLEALFF